MSVEPGQPPSRVDESRPPLLGDWFVYLSIVVLVCGVIVITAHELGGELSDGIVRVPAMIGGGLLLILSLDAAVRVWRSAWAWLPVNRARGLFRFAWVAVLVAIAAAAIGWLWIVVLA
jgi:hypothetical protein